MINHNNTKKIEILTGFYQIYEDFISTVEDLACKEFCAHCCTRSVAVTSLEADWAIARLAPAVKAQCLETLNSVKDQGRFLPLVTTNTIADLTIEGKDIPCEENDHDFGPCPLLSANRCTIYSSRPFACRCMVSNQNCLENGFARMDPFILTVNNVFLQYIEHLDSGGVSGNLIDVFLMMGDGVEATLPVNRPARMLMVPPEHRGRLGPMVKALGSLMTN